MKIGYARILRGDYQDLDPQLRTWRAAGCEIVFREEASGGQADCPELAKALARIGPGDVLCVWKLDRLSRSLRDLLFTLELLDRQGIVFHSLTEAIDTATPVGRLMMQMLGAFAEFEREMIRERTLHGLDSARKAGWHIDRKPSLSIQQQCEVIRMIEEGRGTPVHAANLFNVSPSTVKRVLRAHRAQEAA